MFLLLNSIVYYHLNLFTGSLEYSGLDKFRLYTEFRYVLIFPTESYKEYSFNKLKCFCLLTMKLFSVKRQRKCKIMLSTKSCLNN